jgi:hypothetical protein
MEFQLPPGKLLDPDEVRDPHVLIAVFVSRGRALDDLSSGSVCVVLASSVSDEADDDRDHVSSRARSRPDDARAAPPMRPGALILGRRAPARRPPRAP